MQEIEWRRKQEGKKNKVNTERMEETGNVGRRGDEIRPRKKERIGKKDGGEGEIHYLERKPGWKEKAMGGIWKHGLLGLQAPQSDGLSGRGRP